jgi:hypothetical protein
MNVLHLNLKRKWFDMILSGEKKEEYRKSSAYWTGIFSRTVRLKGKNYHPTDVTICFSNGYSKNRRQLFIECEGVHIGEGRPEWGAEKGESYFVIRLGKTICTKNL